MWNQQMAANPHKKKAGKGATIAHPNWLPITVSRKVRKTQHQNPEVHQHWKGAASGVETHKSTIFSVVN
jgi:hypothetical protein